MKFTSVYTNPKKFTSVINEEAINILIDCSAPFTSSLVLTFTGTIYIFWGDGTKSLLTSGVSATHDYATGKYNLKIWGDLSGLTTFNAGGVNMYINVSDFQYAPNLEYLYVTNTLIKGLYGSLNANTKLKRVNLQMPYTTCIGTITLNIDLTPDLEMLEIQGQENPNITGHWQNVPKMFQYCCKTNVEGDITGLTLLEYLSHSAVGHKPTYGTISDKALLWYFAVADDAGNSSNQITGKFDDLDNLEEVFAVPALMDVPVTLANMTKLSNFNLPAAWNLNVTHINQYLADLYANRNVARVHSTILRYDLRGGNTTAAPTGQGIIDMVGILNDLKTTYCYTRLSLGAELVTNPTFASATGWTLQSGHTILGGKFHINVTTQFSFQFVAGLVAGHYYLTKFTIDSIDHGSIDVYIDSASGGRSSVKTWYLLHTFTGAGFIYIENADSGYPVVAQLSEVSTKEIL